MVGRIRDEDEPEAKQYPVEFLGGTRTNDLETKEERERQAKEGGFPIHEDCSIFVQRDLRAGTYIAFTEVWWEDQEACNQFVFRTYCPDETMLSVVSKNDYPDFLSEVCADCAHKNSKLYKFKNPAHKQIL
jgi:hypothetical protein